MHELAITEEIVRIACEEAKTRRVTRIVVDVGALMAVFPDAVQFCFPMCSEGTVAENAELEIHELPARGKCPRCEKIVEVRDVLEGCPCGGVGLRWLSGDELRIRTMEMN